LGRIDTASALGRCKSLPTLKARQGKARQGCTPNAGMKKNKEKVVNSEEL